MNKTELQSLFQTDKKYASIITTFDEWIKDFIASPNETKAKRGAEYIKSNIGLLVASEELLTGVFKDKNDIPKAGSNFNKYALDIFRDTLLSVRYRIALVNREVHKTINNINPSYSVLDEVLDSFIDKGCDYMKRDFIPAYITELNLKLV